jgi:hypothetical protein
VLVIKLVNKFLNSEAIIKLFEVFVPDGNAFYIFYCNEETSFLDFNYSALNFVIC